MFQIQPTTLPEQAYAQDTAAITYFEIYAVMRRDPVPKNTSKYISGFRKPDQSFL